MTRVMEVVTAAQAEITEDAGAVAVMAFERVPADIRTQGGVSRLVTARSAHSGPVRLET